MGQLMDRAVRQRLLWLDHTDYSTRLLAAGRAPWLQPAACVAWQRQAQGLLHSDVVTLPLVEVASAWLAGQAEVRAAMSAQTKRAHGPLKAWLASEPLRAHAVELATALRAGLPKQLFVLELASARDWAAQALVAAGVTADIDEDAIDTSAVAIASFLGPFASVGVDALLIREASPWAIDEESLLLELTQPLSNVAGHYGWDWGLQWPEPMQLPAGRGPGFTIAPGPCGVAPAGISLGPDFWHGAPPPPPAAGTFDHACIPADAQPEAVLARLASLRERVSSW